MKHLSFLKLLPLLALAFLFNSRLIAGGGDTTIVTTWVNDEYTWPETHQKTFGGFPDSTISFRKAFLRYTLGCAAGGCDPWDVGAPIFVLVPIGGGQYDWVELARYITPYSKTGVWDFDVTDYLPLLQRDSVRLAHRNASYTGGPDGYAVSMDFYFIEGTPPRKPYKVEKLWQGGHQYGNNYVSVTPTLAVDTNATGDSLYNPVYDHFIVYDATTSFDSVLIGTGGTTNFYPFAAGSADSHTQLLYTASELSTLGIGAGDITGIRFNVTTPGSLMRHMTVRIKHTTLSDFSGGSESDAGWVTVYDQFTTLGSAGWLPLHFTAPFNWNGTDNIVVSISFDNQDILGTDVTVGATTTAAPQVAYNSDLDYYMSFSDTSSVQVPALAMAGLDSFVTITFWQYGDMDKLPNNTIIFEAVDASNQRVINIHLPWSDRNVYWDCGNAGTTSYDRINRATTSPYDYKAQWNYWAFVKNVATGEMKTYLNGDLWMSGTGKTRVLSPITSARIGAGNDGSLVCNSKVDEFTIFNAEVDSLTLAQWMKRKMHSSHPFYSNVVAYYSFDDGSGTNISDDSPAGNDATVDGAPDWEGHNREEASYKFAYNTSLDRPDVIVEQGVYTSHMDSVLVDSTLSIIMDSTVYYNHFDSTVTPIAVNLDAGASQFRIKSRTSGHGFGGALNCAEFCPRLHNISLNGTEIFTWLNWKDDCGMNACYPQGGTWIYDRAGWCPGEPTVTNDFELTPFVTAGTTVSLDYGVQPYTWDGGGSVPTWELANHLIYYKAPSFSVNAAIEDVISPNNKFFHRRFNPICSHPEVTIVNNGTTPLTSMEIVYRVPGGADSVFHWTGSLDFLEKENVMLGGVDWNTGSTTFEVFVRNPNGIADEYAIDDTMRTHFEVAPTFPNKVVLFWRTNSKASETKYTVKDETGTTLYTSSVFVAANTIYRDTLRLNKGCYELRVWDTDGDGLSFFANSDGAGFFRINSAYDGTALKVLDADFGTQVLVDFRVDSNLVAVEDAQPEPHINLFPNPTSGEFFVDLSLEHSAEVNVEVYSPLGVKVKEWNFGEKGSDMLSLDLKGLPAGAYMVVVKAGERSYSERIVLTGTK